jgi:Rho GTPase-activating protein RGD1
VADLLKQFIRELPNPLLTKESYIEFIEAPSKFWHFILEINRCSLTSLEIAEDIVRRDSIHALFNALPDAHYAVLRAFRVATYSKENRMRESNLAIIFGPLVMIGASTEVVSHIRDTGWQIRVMETILSNTFQIFDPD